jgi:DnaJ-like protein
MRASRQTDPFTVLGLPARAGLSDDEVRTAWRRIAAATHPDRTDGGDAARFAAAAAAYTALRTSFGRAEALADLVPPGAPGGPRMGPGRWPSATVWVWRRRRPSAGGERRRRPPTAGLLAGRWWARVRRGRPVRLALRIAAAAAVSIAVALIAGARPATPALIMGVLTWLALTARHDLAPPG